MSKQLTLDTDFEKFSKPTKREKFLAEMDHIVPWSELCALIAPKYPKAGDGRPPRELEMMLRTYFLQQWFNLSDPGVEEALYDSVSMRRFVGVDLADTPAPDESTPGGPGDQGRHRYDYRCDDHHRGAVHKDQKEKKRDPDMHQTRKGNPWHFGMKAHIGVDGKTRVIHTVAAPPAHVHDAICLADLLYREETRIWGDPAYQGQGEVIAKYAPKANNLTHRRYRYRGHVDELERAKNRTKSRVRARVEHAFHAILIAVRRRQPRSIIIHSYQDTQYNSDAWKGYCRSRNREPSMGRNGNCWDNVVAESFFSSLKKERTKKHIYRTRELALIDVSDYIDPIYNRTRRHQHPDRMSPEQFEADHEIGRQGVHQIQGPPWRG